MTASKAAPEVSMATLHPSRFSAGVKVAYQSSGAPGGSEPDSTTQSAPRASSSRSAVAASTWAALRAGPSSLILVVVPSGSVMAVLVRTR